MEDRPCTNEYTQMDDMCSCCSDTVCSCCSSESSDRDDELDDDNGIPPPPDGGWGWVIMVVSFLNNMVVDGVAYSFGVFLGELSEHFGVGRRDTAWIGSVVPGCYLMIGPVVSALCNKFGVRAVTICGSFISGLAFFLSTFSPSVGVMIALYGVVGGIGFGCIYLPAVVAVGYYFESKRSTANRELCCAVVKTDSITSNSGYGRSLNKSSQVSEEFWSQADVPIPVSPNSKSSPFSRIFSASERKPGCIAPKSNIVTNVAKYRVRNVQGSASLRIPSGPPANSTSEIKPTPVLKKRGSLQKCLPLEHYPPPPAILSITPSLLSDALGAHPQRLSFDIEVREEETKYSPCENNNNSNKSSDLNKDQERRTEISPQTMSEIQEFEEMAATILENKAFLEKSSTTKVENSF